VHEIQDAILETYRDDFPKYVGAKNVEVLNRACDYLRRHVGQKMKYVNVDREVQARAVRDVVELLFDARVAFAVRRTTASGLPLGAGLDERVYKSYFLDVGLVARTSSIDWIDAETLRSSQFINNGQLAEQFVAQQLWATGASNRAPELFYWLREGRSNNAEVDFLLASPNRVVPIEVKAGNSGTMKSLFQFAKQCGAELAVRFDTNPPSKSALSHEMPNRGTVHLNLLSLPLYFAGQTRRLLTSA
jgi:predicted AAA+ superfamily ATPase